MSGKPRKWSPEVFRNFWLAEDSGCWKWIGNTYPNTYGRISYNGEEICSHRLSWILHKGDIPKGLWILHHCDNPRCVNPEHLFLGTHRDNEDDKVRKGRQRKGGNHYAAKLNAEKVLRIRESKESGASLARDLGVSTSLISMVRSKKVWKEYH